LNIYSANAKRGKGMNLRGFNRVWTNLTGINYHPFLFDIFMFFDRETGDKTIDFREFVLGLNMVERGTFDEKVEYCFAMYDVME
jgi:Ca2+-binding EF-hand superfamily protein